MQQLKPAEWAAPATSRVPPSRSNAVPWDVLAMMLGFALCIAISIRLGAGHIFWEDEVFGWLLLRDPSWHHMVFSWKQGADGGGFLFYLTGRLWFKAFGDSVTSFRLFSATGFGLAFALLWSMARRFYGIGTVAFAMAIGWFFNPTLLGHMAEGRFYGLLLLTTSLVMYVALASLRQTGASAALCIAAFAANSLLVSSHMLGIAYSGMLIVAVMVADRLRHVRRFGLYFSVVASWLWLLPSLPAIRASAAVGRPHFWIKQPAPLMFVLAYTGQSKRTAVVLLVLLLSTAALLFSHSRREQAIASLKSRAPIVLMTLALLLIPIIFFLEGVLGKPLFTDRYLQPVAIGTMLWVAEMVTLIGALKLLPRMWRPVAAGALGVGLLGALLHFDLFYLRRYVLQQRDYTRNLTTLMPATGIPVVCEDAFTFTELMARQAASPVKYIFLLDWEYSISPKAPVVEVTQYHLMDNWRKVGYFSGHIVDRKDFLRDHPEFLVLHTEEYMPASLTHQASGDIRRKLIGNPLTARFAEDGQYTAMPFAWMKQGRLVERATLFCRTGLDCAEIFQQQASRVMAGHVDPGTMKVFEDPR